MKNKVDYSQYKCPYSHLKKDCGHELHGPEGYEQTYGVWWYGVWCACGFRAPVFYLDPDDLGLKKKVQEQAEPCYQCADYIQDGGANYCPNCGKQIKVAEKVQEHEPAPETQTDLQQVKAALIELIMDDAHACTFQSMGQYRSDLVKAIAGMSFLVPAPETCEGCYYLIKNLNAEYCIIGSGYHCVRRAEDYYLANE